MILSILLYARRIGGPWNIRRKQSEGNRH